MRAITVQRLAVLAALMCLLVGACSEEESIEEYNRKQAERLAASRPQGESVKVDTALPGGGKLNCETLFDAAKMTELLGEKEPVIIKDQSKQEVEPNALCSVRRGGKVLSEKEQEEKVKKTAMLGVLAGDELCNIAAFCSIPADEEAIKEKCRAEQMKSTDSIGVYACVKITPKGPHDAYTYQFVDPDSRCVMRVRGGPSVNEETEVQKCAKAALDILTPDAIKPPAQ